MGSGTFALHSTKLKLYHAKKKTYVKTIQKCCHLLWAKAHLKWSEKNGKLFCGQMNHNLKSFWETMDAVSCGLKRRETTQLDISKQFTSHHLWCSGAFFFKHDETKGPATKAQDCWAAWILHQTKMGQHSSPKTPATVPDVYKQLLKKTTYSIQVIFHHCYSVV